MGLYRAVVLILFLLFLLRHNNAQDVAGELFGVPSPPSRGC